MIQFQDDSNSNVNEKKDFEAEITPSASREEPEINIEINNGNNQQLKDHNFEDDDIEMPNEAENIRNNESQRGRGRPKLLRTCQPGRPKKIYQQSTNVSDDPVNVEEAMKRSDWSL